VEARFAVALSRLVRYFNLIDENVGLAIAHLEKPSSPESVFARLSTMSTKDKLDRLKRILEGRDAQSAADYVVWLQDAHVARSDRNRYLHSHWSFFPYRTDRPIERRSPAWQRAEWGDEDLSISDLEGLASEVEGVFNGLQRFRRKHRV
jgi:hypothetical protein